MNLYRLIETGLIVLIGALSVGYAIRLLMPSLVTRVTASIARWLDRSPSGSWRKKMATRASAAVPNGGCGSNCGSGCHGCGLAARAHLPLAGDDNSSH